MAATGYVRLNGKKDISKCIIVIGQDKVKCVCGINKFGPDVRWEFDPLDDPHEWDAACWDCNRCTPDSYRTKEEAIAAWNTLNEKS